MDYDTEKADEMALALLYLTSFQERHGPLRAWKGMDWDTLNRLHEKGLISDPKSKAKSVCLTDGIMREPAFDPTGRPDPRLIPWLSIQEFDFKRPYFHYRNSLAAST